MKRNLTVIAILSLCTLLSCTGSEELTVYKVKPLEGGKTIDVIEGDNVRLTIKVGDTVRVNLSDAEIVALEREDRFVCPTCTYTHIVQSSYKSYKY